MLYKSSAFDIIFNRISNGVYAQPLDTGGFIMAKDEKETFVLHDGRIGDVQIAADVIAVIAGLAAMEVEGVDSMAGNITKELISRLGVRNLSKGVNASLKDNGVLVSLALNLKYGYNVKDISGKVQERVKSMIENMTGLDVLEVDVRVAGVAIDKEGSR